MFRKQLLSSAKTLIRFSKNTYQPQTELSDRILNTLLITMPIGSAVGALAMGSIEAKKDFEKNRDLSAVPSQFGLGALGGYATGGYTGMFTGTAIALTSKFPATAAASIVGVGMYSAHKHGLFSSNKSKETELTHTLKRPKMG